MKKFQFFKMASGLAALLLILAFALPARAFYMEVPKDFAQNWQTLIEGKKAQSIKGVLGIEEVNSNPAETAPAERPVAPEPIAPAPVENPPMPPSTDFRPIDNFTAPQEINKPLPPPETGDQSPRPEIGNPPPQTCRVNGVDMPGSCDQYNNNGGNQGDMMPKNQPDRRNQDGQNFKQGPNQQNGGGQDQQKNQERMMQDVKRGIKQMESSLKRLEPAFKKAEAKGTVMPAEVKEKLEKAKSLIEAMKAAQTPEAMQEIDMGELGEVMQSLEQFRQDIVDTAQRMDGMKRGIKGMESGLKAFESQIARLVKQKIAIPEAVTENLNKVKAIVAAVKNAKTMEEMEAAGVEDLQEIMQSLDENRGQLEMLARWPQTLKQLNRELTRLTKELKTAKAMVEKLKKKEIDLSDVYAQFEAAVAKMKTVKEEAEKSMIAGASTDIFDTIQEEFFGQMEETMQYQRVIMTMSNLSRFASDFKRGIAQAQAQIRRLKAKKIDTSEVAVILNDMNNQGKEILVMIKAKPIDEDAVTSALEEMEILSQNFSDKIAELTGEEDIMPWEQGPQQFKQPRMPDNWQQLVPQPKVQAKEPMPSVESQQ